MLNSLKDFLTDGVLTIVITLIVAISVLSFINMMNNFVLTRDKAEIEVKLEAMKHGYYQSVVGDKVIWIKQENK